MLNALTAKLTSHSELGSADQAFFETACGPGREVPAGKDLIMEGDTPTAFMVMLEGWACRYKLLPSGSRQILAFLIPGDSGGMQGSMKPRIEHSVATITPARVAFIPRARMTEMLVERPALSRALTSTQSIDGDTLREWMASLGRRNSVERTAHLMCELYVRSCSIAPCNEWKCPLPLTQTELGDALGLTAVHVNRVLRRLRLGAVMTLAGGVLTIHDFDKLAGIAGFDDHYLHPHAQSSARMRHQARH